MPPLAVEAPPPQRFAGDGKQNYKDAIFIAPTASSAGARLLPPWLRTWRETLSCDQVFRDKLCLCPGNSSSRRLAGARLLPPWLRTWRETLSCDQVFRDKLCLCPGNSSSRRLAGARLLRRTTACAAENKITKMRFLLPLRRVVRRGGFRAVHPSGCV
jgi:hypothetical protein